MRNRALAAAFIAAVAHAAVPGIASAGARPQLTVVVRVYDGYGMGGVESGAARTSLKDVFADAGITFTWIDCLAAGRDSDPCAAPPARGELVVRFVHSSIGQPGDPVAMGDALVSGAGTGTVVTVYPDEVQRAVGAWNAAGPLLGRVMAHEVGHLLLGAHAHAKDGLMRPIWSREEIARDSRFDWRFSKREIGHMRERLAARLESSPA